MIKTVAIFPLLAVTQNYCDVTYTIFHNYHQSLCFLVGHVSLSW